MLHDELGCDTATAMPTCPIGDDAEARSGARPKAARVFVRAAAAGLRQDRNFELHGLLISAWFVAFELVELRFVSTQKFLAEQAMKIVFGFP